MIPLLRVREGNVVIMVRPGRSPYHPSKRPIPNNLNSVKLSSSPSLVSEVVFHRTHTAPLGWAVWSPQPRHQVPQLARIWAGSEKLPNLVSDLPKGHFFTQFLLGL